MNLFEIFSTKIKTIVKKNKDLLNLSNLNEFKGVTVENPPSEFNFELSCNICLILGKINNLKPQDLAVKIKKIFLTELKEAEVIEVAGPGFLNIRLESGYIQKIIKKIAKSKNSYGSSSNNENYNIEFVSANPTGPMHVGHCRGAIYGDVLANLLKFNGNTVTKEYYINDYGSQIKNFTESVFLRIRELKYKEKFINKKDLYPGEYIVTIANNIIQDNPKLSFDKFDDSFELLKKSSLFYSMKLIKNDLQNLGIKHDKYVQESELVDKDLVANTIKNLKQNKFVEEGYLSPPKGEEIKNWVKTKRLIFKSTKFNDDMDRALQKNDGTWTYFANDIAYHMDKISRKYDHLINVLGADHTGYIKRITAAVSALSNDKVSLDCRVCRLVKLYKNGKPFKMSKRSGDFISVNDLLSEVDKDSIRFMMLNRSNDVELDFDFDKVLEKTKENPVYYVQYSYARINSLFRTLKINIDDEIDIDEKSFNLNIYEKHILRKIFDWPKIVETASIKYEPHRIPFYLYNLATLFHSYWSKGNDDKKYKFLINGKIKNKNTLVIIKLCALVIKNGMNILNVSLPDRM